MQLLQYQSFFQLFIFMCTAQITTSVSSSTVTEVLKLFPMMWAETNTQRPFFVFKKMGSATLLQLAFPGNRLSGYNCHGRLGVKTNFLPFWTLQPELLLDENLTS